MKKWMCLLCGVVTLVVGCGKSPEATNEPPPAAPRQAADPSDQVPDPPLYDMAAVQAEMDMHLSGGDTNAAIAYLDGLLDESPEGLDRGIVFRVMLELMHQAGQIEEAKVRYTSALSEDLPSAEAAFGIISGVYGRGEDWDGLESWTSTLLTRDMPEQMTSRALLWNLTAHMETNNVAAIEAGVLAWVGKLPVQELSAVAEQMRRSLGQQGLLAEATSLVDALAGAVGDAADWTEYLLTAKLRNALDRSDWDGAESLLDELLEKANDSTLRNAVSDWFGRVSTAQDKQVRIDRVSQRVLERVSKDSATARMVASRWVRAGAEAGDIPVLISRVKRLVDGDYPEPVIVRALRDSIYVVLREPMSDDAKNFVSMIAAVEEGLQDEGLRDDTRALRFDGLFMQEDYDGVLACLDEGLVGRDEDWHSMARNKVLAHKALAEEDFAVAAARFKDFMGFIDKTWERPERDPATGMMHTREMALGYNAKRIGNLLTKAGDATGAAAAYAESRAYYEKALAEHKAGTPEYEEIAGALKTLP